MGRCERAQERSVESAVDHSRVARNVSEHGDGLSGVKSAIPTGPPREMSSGLSICNVYVFDLTIICIVEYDYVHLRAVRIVV